MKIISTLQGGLGNQLFQWALTKSLEEKYNCEVYLDVQEFRYDNWAGITKRTFDLPQFSNLKFKIADEVSDINLKNDFIELYERDFNPNFVKLDSDNNYKLFGYWQNYTFFNHKRSSIMNELMIPSKLKNELINKYPELDTNCVSLHIRRTDYLTSNGFHPVQDLLYYKKALDIIGDYDNVLIFSDDIEWCKKNMNFKNQKFVENNLPSIDVWLMSLCKHNIIANSSFSWWGAWLNNNINKKVIKPSKWFSYGDSPQMCPPEWIKI